MRIALLLSGNLRTFDSNQCTPKISDYYKKLADKYDLDVFCFTDDHNFVYNNIQHIKRTCDDMFELGHGVIDRNHTFVDRPTAYGIISNLLQKCFDTHLKRFEIIPYQKFFVPISCHNMYHERFYNDTCRPTEKKHGLLNNAFKIYQAYCLMQEYEQQHGFQYDIVIKSRFDCIPYDILNKIDIRDIDYSNTLVCGNWPGFIFDQGAIGNRTIMHHYCHYYQTISPNLIKEKRMYWSGKTTGFVSQEPNRGLIDISDSIEYGLTYLVKDIHQYNVNDYSINFRYPIA